MAATQHDINTNFQKLEKFEGVEFRRWQKKMHFLLTTLKVVYVLSTPRPPEEEENESLETSYRRIKWDNADYICRGHILNGLCMRRSPCRPCRNLPCVCDVKKKEKKTKYPDQKSGSHR
ncbi:unnamed protein product [Cuscuta europaea]|uniref:Zinc finger, CCHC-type n=1 Tax=Cuscuta europaea TaxID=41803 RepID=A0A9P1E2Y7_CUSEU|nr:unnamed protein product [Cuscuta europaea]